MEYLGIHILFISVHIYWRAKLPISSAAERIHISYGGHIFITESCKCIFREYRRTWKNLGGFARDHCVPRLARKGYAHAFGGTQLRLGPPQKMAVILDIFGKSEFSCRRNKFICQRWR